MNAIDKKHSDSETNLDNGSYNLVNNNVSFDKIREKTSAEYDKENSKNKPVGDNAGDDLIEKIKDLRTTETDMMFQYFANDEKMVHESEVKFFEKPKNDYDIYDKYSDKQDDIKNNINKTEYINEDKNNDSIKDDNINTQQPPQPQPSQYGPSYGSGPSYPDNSKNKEFATEEEEMLAKLDMLRKLGELTQYGVRLSQNYNIKSEYRAMKYEYELHKSIRDKRNGTKWLSNMMLNMCWGLELANEKFNPFDFHLKGWSEQMAEDINDYDDVYGELYEKYFKAGKPIPPELKLIFMITGSAVKFHLAHSAMNSLPNLGSMLSSNPQLADKLRQQAVTDKLKKQSEKFRTNFTANSQKQHENATKKATDIQMLRQKEIEFNEKQENLLKQQREKDEIVKLQQQDIFHKQKKIDDLQRQLNQQRSESRSYDGSLASKSGYVQKTMKPPIIPQSLRQTDPTEITRQHNIMNQKKLMQQKEFNKTDTPSYDDGSVVSVNPNVDKIIRDKLDTASKINEGSSIDASEISGMDVNSNGIVVSRKKRQKKKPTIAINTN